MANTIREKHSGAIEALSLSIAQYDEAYHRTGIVHHKIQRDKAIASLKELKEEILAEEARLE